jgi:DNA (cytosine-5)-methyltransferase 1
VQTDLETAGYKILPFLLPAAGVNAPHQRFRVFFIAHARISGNSRNTRDVSTEAKETYIRGKEQSTTSKQQVQIPNIADSLFGDVSNSCNEGLQGRQVETSIREKEREGEFHRNIARQICTGFENFPSQPPICGRDDGLPRELDNITFSKWRSESIKGYGNAIVVPLVHQIFKAIQKYEDSTGTVY